MSPFALFNTAFAVVVALTAVRSIARMNGTTPHCIRFAIVLIFVACLGQALGVVFHEWDHWIDTLFYTGVFVLLVFNRRYKRPEADASPITHHPSRAQ